MKVYEVYADILRGILSPLPSPPLVGTFASYDQTKTKSTPLYFKISNIRNMRANMNPTSVHFSSPTAFPQVRIWHNGSQYVSKGSGTQREVKNIQNRKF